MNLEDIFYTISNLSICLFPLLGVFLIAIGIIAYMNHKKREKREYFENFTKIISGNRFPEIEKSLSIQQQPNDLILSELINISRFLNKIVQGDITPVSKNYLENSLHELQSYRQKANYGNLPNDIDKLRNDELNCVTSLCNSVQKFLSNLNSGDANQASHYFKDSVHILSNTIEEHQNFRKVLEEQKITFPIPQPVQTTAITTISNLEYSLNQIMQEIPPEKHTVFLMQYNSVQKNPTTAVLLAILLGGVGAHKFYMGKIGTGVLYILFSWTWIPAIIGVIEAFGITNQVKKYNIQKALELAQMFK